MLSCFFRLPSVHDTFCYRHHLAHIPRVFISLQASHAIGASRTQTTTPISKVGEVRGPLHKEFVKMRFLFWCHDQCFDPRDTLATYYNGVPLRAHCFPGQPSRTGQICSSTCRSVQYLICSPAQCGGESSRDAGQC